MIKKVSRIKNFGIYKDFSWNQLDDFKKKNLIYGWNYSGKTTLSKLFELLEFKNAERHFKGSEFDFEIEHDENSILINQENIIDCPFIIKVFNSEYIKRVFTWDLPGSDIEPISFYLGDPAGDIKSKLDRLEKENERLFKIKEERYKKIANRFSEYSKPNGKFSDQAKEIRDEYLPRLLQTHEFNKSHFQTRANTVKSDLEKHILDSTKKNKTKEQALSQNTFLKLDDDFKFSENLLSLTSDVKKVLEDSAPKAIPFPELDQDKELFDWVQKGLTLHENGENCKFCTNSLPNNRIENLNSYYSEKLQEIQDEISRIRKRIEDEIELVSLTFENELKLGGVYRKEYQENIATYKDNLKAYKVQLKTLKTDLDSKGKHIFNSISASNIDEISLTVDVSNIEAILKKHNTWLSEFDERKQKAVNKILNHYVAEYLKSEDYLSKEKESNSAKSIIDTIKARIADNDKEILSLNSQLSDKVKGKEELNTSLELLLNRDDIKIDISDDKFILKRDIFPATNLSEGEKSAIAFSYFLTELKSLSEESKLDKTIIFIDDPISSLDSNHIFQVRSLIQNFFTKNSFKQLFISTHSFEFLSVLLDTRLFGPTNREAGETKRPLYYIQRLKEGKAIIKKLPKAFSSYKSEYVGLFEIIKAFSELENKEDFPNILILPNAVRRFLELYTLMKYPSEKEVDRRVKEVFNPNSKPYHNTKLLHWFSHQNQVEKVQRHDDKLLQIEGAVDELLTYIENNDKLHWQGLIGD